MTLAPSTARASSIRPTPNNLGLVGYWSFEDASGTQATDFSGNGNIGTLNSFGLTGATSNWVTGKRGKALDFDGTDDYVILSDSAALSPGTGDITVSAWAKTNVLNSAGHWIYSDYGNDNNALVLLRLDTNNLFQAFFRDTGGTQTVSAYNTTALATGTWYHVVAVKSGKTALIYLNGVQEASSTNNSLGTITTNDGKPPVIGTYGTTPGGNFNWNGTIDDFRIYNRALSATEVASLYAQTSITKIKNAAKGLVAYYPMSEGAGTTTADATGQGNTGTFGASTGAPTWTTSGKFGNGISFDGSNDYVNTGVTVSSLGLTNKATFSFWAKKVADSTTSPFGNNNEGSDGQDRDVFSFFDVAGTFWLRANAGSQVTLNAGTWSAGVWYNVVGVYDGSTLKLYVNGVEIASSALTGNLLSTSATWKMGRRGEGSGLYYWNGVLDDVRIYNRALSATEVLNLYNDTSGVSQHILNGSMNTQLTSGLVGMWDFNGPRLNSTTSTDASGNGNNGALTGATGAQNKPQPKPGVIGQALNFDGTDDYLSLGSNSITGTSAYSIAAWLKAANTTQGSGGYGVAVTMGNGASGQQAYVGWVGTAQVGTSVSYGGGGYGKNYGSGITDITNWHHVAMTSSGGGTQTITIYVDGVQTNQSTETFSIASTARRIGAGDDGGVLNYYYNGLVDEARVYNRALSASEVYQLYSQGR